MAGILIGRREVIVRGDGNCFYRAIARAIDEKSDKNHMKVRALCNNTLAHFPNVFEPLLFACNTIKERKVVGTVLGQKLLTFTVVLLYFSAISLFIR